MYRWNSRGYNTTSNRNRSNLSEFSSTSVISARSWIGNVFKTFFSLLSIFQFRRTLGKVNPINCSACLLSAPQSISCSCLSFPCSYYHKSTSGTNTPSTGCSGSKSSSINNSNIPGSSDNPQPRLRKMTQILSKTMTLLGVAFLIHFIIMSTFAEREGYSHRFSSVAERHQHIRRQQRSYRNEKHTLSPDENTLAPVRFHNKTEAMFFTENSTIIIAQIGSKTYLPCAVRNLGSGVASWIRRRDYTLLTVGMGTYSNDDRFVVSHNRAAQSWELHIKFVKESDEGVYECQISTHPPSSIFIHLSVVEAKAEILGEPDKHVRSGSTFELVCVLRDSTEPPVYVFWYHNDRMINYDNVRGVVVNSDTEKSILTIQDAQKSDSGNYTCVPSNARPTSISVHILNGEKPAAMQHGSRNDSGREVRSSLGLLFVTTVAVFLLTAWLVTTNLNRNLCYLRQLDAPPSPQPIENGKQDVGNQNLQIVHIHPTEESVHWSSIHSHLHRLVYEEESACADKVDMRFEKIPEPALQIKRLSPIVSTSRVYILEISYHQLHIRNNSSDKTVSPEIHGFLAISTSNCFPSISKKEPDADVHPECNLTKESRHSSRSPHPFSISPVISAHKVLQDLTLVNFSSLSVPLLSYISQESVDTPHRVINPMLHSQMSESDILGLELISR